MKLQLLEFTVWTALLWRCCSAIGLRRQAAQSAHATGRSDGWPSALTAEPFLAFIQDDTSGGHGATNASHRFLNNTAVAAAGAAQHDKPATSSSQPARHVVYTADATVFGALARSMQSLALHLEDPTAYVIDLIVPEDEVGKAEKLAACFSAAWWQGPKKDRRATPRINVRKVQPMPFRPDYRDRVDLQGHATAFARLFLADQLVDVDRALYLDTDTLIAGDVAPLFEWNLTQPLAAVEEGTSFADTWAKWYSNLAQLVPDPHARSIFNDGVLVFDLQRWRRENITSDLQRWAADVGARVDDQFFFNLEFQVKKGFDVLPHEWNDYRVRSTGWPEFGWSDELTPDDPLSHAKIMHWTGPKPWALQDKERWLRTYRSLWQGEAADAETSCDTAYL
eukprot:TRINITY_DN5504_c0_g1_i1.p1 TRINITY_DN5504_c0_g1~~TRINITY_DN5504_c0_g1_i1.p1  ORF type:complete len:394 (+),score=75.30 TRINITY_DN5504_c0_g1_i1:126-1307(+)